MASFSQKLIFPAGVAAILLLLFGNLRCRVNQVLADHGPGDRVEVQADVCNSLVGDGLAVAPQGCIRNQKNTVIIR